MDIQSVFEKQGGIFLSSAEDMANKLKDIRCFVFDWDGVFNNGIKADPKKGSPFSEPDSMGLNMLRFSHWLLYGKLPITAIITGANNLTAIDFAKREHLHAAYLNSKNKKETLEELASKYDLQSNQVAFTFDDILDLNAAEISHLSFYIRRQASPLLQDFISRRKLCDYISGREGGNHAIREITELINGLYGNYDDTVSKRMEYSGDYKRYLDIRNAVNLDIANVANNS